MKKKESKQKKMDVRVDFTPMVDMMMLLITFFMLCTSLAKPQTMELSMPTNDKVQDQDKTVTKASYTITIYVCANDKIYYINGQPKYDDPSCMKETTWGRDGIRKVLIDHVTEDGTTPVQQVMAAKAALDRKKLADPKKYTDSVYNAELAKIKSGDLGNEKISTMTVIIKATDKATYKNLVDALDEMQICSIGKYVIDKINPNDLKLLKRKGIE